MNVLRMSKRMAATGAVAALAAAGLVGASTTAAQATPIMNSYSCSNATYGLGPWAVTLDSDAPGIEGFTTVPAGFDAPAGILSLNNTFTIPSDAHTTLQQYGVENLAFPDFAGTFGGNPVGVAGMTAKVSEMTANDDGTYSFDSNGLNDAFEAPAAGTFGVLSPASFNLVATVPALGGDVPVACVLATGTEAGSYTTINVVKNASTSTGKALGTPLTHTTKSKMRATVSAPNQVPTGKVLVKEGTKTLGSAILNDSGVAKVNLGKLSKGKHKVKVVYKGDGYTKASKSDVIVLRVR